MAASPVHGAATRSRGARPPGRRRATCVLPGGPESVSIARSAVASLLRDWCPKDIVDTAVLLTSETVTNAIIHANSDVRMSVDVDAERVRVSVTDASPERPTVRRPSLDALGGRGVYLLDSLATRWGVRNGRRGKTVWFELSL